MGVQEKSMNRAKFQTTAEPSETAADVEKNPRRHYKSKGARAPGRSGKGVVRESKKAHSRRA
jgi:hypothetical protein